MSSSDSYDSLQTYIDDLLSDSLLSDAALSDIKLGEGARKDEYALKLAAGSNIASLPSAAARPARVATTRPYAEPIRTLNLRMPLPPVVPPVADIAPAVAVVETKLVVEAKPVVEAKHVVETIPAIQTAPLLETKPIVEVLQHVESKLADVVLPPPAAKAAPVVPAESLSHAPSVEAQIGSDLASMAEPAAWLSNGRPQWAQQPFECLIFTVGGLQLAAPLVELGSIYPLEEGALTEIFGQTHWFMGLLPVKEYNVRAMDTALVVMPERYSAPMRENYRYVLSLFGSDWGLAVDGVVGTMLLDPDRIRWRGERSKRPWLAGTLIDQMCALFDITQLAWLFHNQDRKRVPR